MLRSSIPLGRFFGVDVRIHASFPLLLAVSVVYSVATGGSAARGFGLWLALCFAVVVRECARAVAAAYSDLRLRAIFLLPVGGVMAFAPGERRLGGGTRLITVAGPAANFFVAVMLFGTAYGVAPHVNLVSQPWIGTTHILRSFVWLQMVLGALSLLPSAALPARQLLRSGGTAPAGQPSTQQTAGPAFGWGTAASLAIVVAGIVLPNLWFVMVGGFLLLSAQMGTRSAVAPEGDSGDSILVRDVMVTEYTLLSTSDTLRDALLRTAHSLHDVFPVVRGNQLVGSVARQTLTDKLLAEGDGYLQGIMTRRLQLAEPTERLVDALRRVASAGASEFIPVVQGGAMLGILTQQSLSAAVQQVQILRPPVEERVPR